MAGYIYRMKRLLGRPTEFADLFKGFNFFIPAPGGHAGITLSLLPDRYLRHPRTGGGSDV
jgi:hypothetical protein